MAGLMIPRRAGAARPLGAPVIPPPAIRTSVFGRGNPVAKPATAVDTDLMLLAMHAQGGVHSGPADWTLLRTITFPGSFSVWRLWGKVVASGDSASWSWSDSNAILNWSLVVLSGANQTIANHLHNENRTKVTGTNNINSPVVTTVVPNCLPVQFLCDAAGNQTTWTWPANTTKLGQTTGTIIPVAAGHDTVAQAAAGNTTQRLLTGDGFADPGVITVAVAPA